MFITYKSTSVRSRNPLIVMRIPLSVSYVGFQDGRHMNIDFVLIFRMIPILGNQRWHRQH